MTILQRFHQRISLENCSRAYLWAQLATMLVYLLYFMGYTLPFINAQQPGLIAAFLLKHCIEAACFISLSHLLIRPMLKAWQNAKIGWRYILSLVAVLSIASLIQSVLSYSLAHLKILKVTDMSQLTVHDPAQTSSFQMTFSPTFVITSYATMFLAMYLVWVFAYVVWHNWQARKALQQQMQQAQLQQLTNQLSPHFLFNAFNSIRALIFEDQHKAADTVTRLSELFRFHLQAHLQPESTLQQEWQLTEQYLTIEQVRLEHRLQFHCDIDPTLWQRKMPTLSLLTLVENAIKHGIAPQIAAGELRIQAQANASGWTLQVINSVQNHTQQAGTGTGLANLRQRLQLMHAGNAVLILQPGAKQFTARLEFNHV